MNTTPTVHAENAAAIAELREILNVGNDEPLADVIVRVRDAARDASAIRRGAYETIAGHVGQLSDTLQALALAVVGKSTKSAHEIACGILCDNPEGPLLEQLRTVDAAGGRDSDAIGGLAFAFRHWSSVVLVQSLGRSMPADAKNYVQLSLTDSSGARWTVIIRRPRGKTPHELQMDAERERDEARREADHLRDLLAAERGNTGAHSAGLVAELQALRAEVASYRARG